MPAVIIAGTVILAGVAAFLTMTVPRAIFSVAVFIVLGWISYTDIREHKIKNIAILVLLALAVVSMFLWDIPLRERLIATGIVLVSFLLLLAFIKNGIGMGDIKMLAVLSFMMGYGIVYVIFGGSVLQVIYILIQKLRFKKEIKGVRIAAGPFYSLAAALTLILFY